MESHQDWRPYPIAYISVETAGSERLTQTPIKWMVTGREIPKIRRYCVDSGILFWFIPPLAQTVSGVV